MVAKSWVSAMKKCCSPNRRGRKVIRWVSGTTVAAGGVGCGEDAGMDMTGLRRLRGRAARLLPFGGIRSSSPSPPTLRPVMCLPASLRWLAVSGGYHGSRPEQVAGSEVALGGGETGVERGGPVRHGGAGGKRDMRGNVLEADEIGGCIADDCIDLSAWPKSLGANEFGHAPGSRTRRFAPQALDGS